MDKQYPETIIYTDQDRVWCMGEDMDHPKVYFKVPEQGYVKCNYCDIKFMRKEKENDRSRSKQNT